MQTYWKACVVSQMFTPFLIKSRCSTGNLAEEKVRPGHSIKGIEIEVQEALPKPAEARERSFHGIFHGDFYKKNVVFTIWLFNIAMERSTHF